MAGTTIKTLILRLSSIGDIILTTPFLRRLHAAYPDAEVVFATRHEYADLVRHSPYITKLVEVDAEKGNDHLHCVNRELDACEYTLIFDLHDNFRSRFLRSGLKGELRIINKPTLQWILLVGMKTDTYKEVVPVPERYIATGKDVGLQPDTLGPEIAVPDPILERISNRIRAGDVWTSSPIIGFCPGAKHFTKQWPEEYWLKLCTSVLENTSCSIAVFGGPADRKLGQELESVDSVQVRNLCGDFTLLETAAAMRQCSLVVANDSGLMHMATASSVPVVAIFGSTVRQFGFFPYNSPSAVLETEGLPCRPCTHIGKSHCPKGHFRCMTEILPAHVFNAMTEFLP